MPKLLQGHGYCIKCKGSKEMLEKEFGRYKNNMPIERGKCVSCGTKMNRMLSKEEALKYEIEEK